MRGFAFLRSRLAICAVAVAMVPSATMLGATVNLPESKPKTVAIDYVLTASIEETGTTVGIADSDLWALTTPDGKIDEAAMDAHLDAMQALGVDTVRVVLPWRGNEPWGPPGTLPNSIEQSYWKRSDLIIQKAADRGMGVLAVLNHAPEWGTAFSGSWAALGLEEAPDPQKYADYVSRVVDRYGNKIAAYEIWNEPNAVTGWAPTIDAAAYTEVLKAAYTAIKGANGADENDPLVVAGVLGAGITVGNLTLDPRTFVDTMYKSGAQGFFDALSFHPYHYDLKFSEGKFTPAQPWKANSPLEQVIKIRQLMIDNGDAALKIWATEYGLPTFGANGVTEEEQRDYIENFLNAWKNLKDSQGIAYGGPQFIYTLRDSLVNGVLSEKTSLGIFKYDLLTGQWVEKLAAAVIKQFIIDNANPEEPEEPGSGPNIGQQIAAALQAIFDSIRAAFSSFTSAINSFMNSIARAIASIFGARTAATVAVTTSELDEDATSAEITARYSVSGEGLSDDTTDAGTAGESDGVAASVEGTETAPEPQDPDTTVVVEDVETTVPEEAEETTDVTTEVSTETETVEVTVDPEDTEVTDGSETGTESTVRTGIVARPGKIGDDEAEDADNEVVEAAEPAEPNDPGSEDAGDSGSETN